MKEATMTDKPKGQPLRDAGPYIVTDKRDFLIIMTSDAELAGLIRGERKPLGERQTRRAYPGEWVADLPTVSIGPLLSSGWIRRPTAAELAERSAATKPTKEAKP